ncbi:hypothetical protein [Formosa agariphila]|nr:hypothetical protein [Formosa agariphila]
MHTDTNRPFPKEEREGAVSIVGDKIIVKGNSYHNSEVNIKDMQYAYVLVNVQGESSLFIFDHHQHVLPANYIGFSKVYKQLSSEFGFKDDVFFEHVNQTSVIKKLIWRKVQEATYSILDTNYTDYNLGFEIQSEEKVFISWDDTYVDLNEHEHTFIDVSPYGQKILKFKYPIRIGNVILNNFTAYFDNARTDIPVLHYYTHAINASSSDTSYYELKTRLQSDFSNDNQFFGYEREDQNSFSFRANDIVFSLVYTYDSTYQFNGGYTSFSVKNEREYPEYLVDLDYESKIEVSDFIQINENIRTVSNYKSNSKIKRRPENLKSHVGEAPTLWIDHKNSKIGFADQSYCQVFDKSEIQSFTIQNILPAKGGGGSYLELDFKDNKKSIAIFSGPCHVFNAYQDKLSKLTGLKINIAAEFYDC